MKKLLSIITLATAVISSPALSGHGVSIENPETPFDQLVAKMYPDFKVAFFINFNEKPNRGNSVFMLTKDPERGADYYAEARISFTNYGVRNLYIVTQDDRCNESGYHGKTVLDVSNQKVFFNRYCDSFYYYSPETDAGKKYLVDTFKKAKYVTITGLVYPLIFDATGFTKQWDSFGGDVL